MEKINNFELLKDQVQKSFGVDYVKGNIYLNWYISQTFLINFFNNFLINNDSQLKPS